MGFVLPCCLGLLKRECKGIIYYNPFHSRQMLHVLCNYNTFGKLFLPTHMLGKSSNCARETFLHKVNFLIERNCKLDLGLQDLQAHLSPWGLRLPHNLELTYLPPGKQNFPSWALHMPEQQLHWVIPHTRPQHRCSTTKTSLHPCPYNGSFRMRVPDVLVSALHHQRPGPLFPKAK